MAEVEEACAIHLGQLLRLHGQLGDWRFVAGLLCVVAGA